MKTEHWLIGAAVVGGGLFLLHNASAGEPTKKPDEKPKPDAKPATTPTPATAAPAPTAKQSATSALPVGTHVEAQYRDGQWYGGTVQNTNLADPDAIKWDAGTSPAKTNPKTGSSPAQATRAAVRAAPAAPPAKGAPAPSPDELKEIARKALDAANAGAAPHADENPLAALGAVLGSILH